MVSLFKNSIVGDGVLLRGHMFVIPKELRESVLHAAYETPWKSLYYRY